MEMEEFLRAPTTPVPSAELVEEEDAMPEDIDVQIDVQKAVVESLAADKAEQEERIKGYQKENYQLKSKITSLEEKLAQQAEALAKVGEVLSQNSENLVYSNKIALIDRDVELMDRFPGETRDTVLEVIKAARDAAEQEGRLRRSQILESVLVANEPIGNLSKKRSELEKFFNDNGNIISGPVIEELKKQGISYKNGEEYLLASEILKRVY